MLSQTLQHIQIEMLEVLENTILKFGLYWEGNMEEILKELIQLSYKYKKECGYKGCSDSNCPLSKVLLEVDTGNDYYEYTICDFLDKLIEKY
jgi:hypothetical protein